MPKYADIIIDIASRAVDRPFSYRVPPEMEDRLKEGMCVRIPFGKGNTERTGYVIAFSDKTEYEPSKVKDIIGIIDAGVSVENRQMALAGFIKKTCGCTMIQAMKTVLPAKTKVEALEIKTIVANVPPHQMVYLLTECKRKKQVARARLLQELQTVESLPYSLVTSKLNVASATIKAMENLGWIKILTENRYRNPVRIDSVQDQRKALSPGQQQIINRFREDFDCGIPGRYLIHGITGSGKTEVYMNLIEHVLEKGRSAIVLIPEIALTYQTLIRFYSRFGDRVSVLSSALSPGEKYDQCERARKGEIDVIIGPRSALFTPFPNLGLIVIDEEHEPSYKSESMPKYHAREVAEELARMNNASLVLGSATPSLEAYYRAQKGEYTLFELTERLTGGELPTVHTIDLRQELKEGNRSIFSRKLQELMTDRLQKGQQIMLFLNRRGYAGFISCRACGHVMKCPHCDVSLSQHRGDKLICHYCGYETVSVHTCPECGSKYISGFKAGTQQIEEKLKALYPDVRTLRMDADTTKTKDSYEKILASFAQGEADVLIGTQMIVKGHDFPNVTLVGVLAADLSLSSNDYRAGERTFQLLTQAVGRAGRGVLPGEAVVQTYQPDHYGVTFAAAQDYKGFYEEEILYRDMLRYPPVCNMMAVQVFSGNAARGAELVQKLADLAKESARSCEANEQTAENAGENRMKAKRPVLVIGPSTATIGKIQDVYRYVFYVKHEKYDTLEKIAGLIRQKEEELQYKGDSVQIDFNPVNPF